MQETQVNDSDFKFQVRERLELPKAVLSQMRETCLFNEIVDRAIDDLDDVIKILSRNESLPPA